jgi:hypothetical protein
MIGKEYNGSVGWKKVGSGIRDKHPGSATLFGCMDGMREVWTAARRGTILCEWIAPLLITSQLPLKIPHIYTIKDLHVFIILGQQYSKQ